jgi:enoyl-CoA hydratase/carnithine racemase
MSETRPAPAAPAGAVHATLLEAGRVLRLVVDRPPGSVLDSATMQALRMATHVARAGSGLRAALAAPLDRAERASLEQVLPSHDGNEGIDAFLVRRAPAWTDA